MRAVQQLRKRLRSTASFLCGGFVLLVAVSCTQTPPEFDLLERLPIPAGASEVQKLHLESPKNQQLFFKIERAYPARDVFDLYDGYFKQEKWIACGGGGWKDGWDSFGDESTKPAQRVHRITSHWVRPDRRALALVSGMYYSAATATAAAPDNAVQRWVILVQKDVDAMEHAKRLSLQCK